MKKFKLQDHIVAISLVIIHFAMWYYFAYIKYSNIEVKNYNYILGFPEWFFYSSIVTSIFIIILVIIFTNILFNEDIKEENNEDR